MGSDERPLRDRKKARTRATIQRHALRLFREQGYEATPVSQIAAAAEISESTFFRYFPTKEDVVMWDDLDPDVLDAIRAQPADVLPVTAIRRGLRQVMGTLSAAEQAELRERMVLVLAILPARVLGAEQLNQPIQLLSEVVAERTGRPPDDLRVRALIGAVLGTCLSVMFAVVDRPDADLAGMLDAAMAELETGFR